MGVGSGSPPQSSSSSTTRAIEAALAASRRIPSSSVRPEDATPTRFPTTNRRLIATFVSATFWWIWLFAKRVSAASSAMTSASDSDAPSRSAAARTRSARASASRARSSFMDGLPLADTDLDVAEARSRHGMPDMSRLAGLALPAIWRAEHHVAALVADGIARSPELVGDARVRRVLEQAAFLAALDLVRDLGSELEVQAPVVNGPRAVRREVQAVVGVGDD